MKQCRKELAGWSFETMRRSVVFTILALSTMTGSLYARENGWKERSGPFLQQGIRGPRGETGDTGAQGNPEVRIKNLPQIFLFLTPGDRAAMNTRYSPLVWPQAAIPDASVGDASGEKYGGYIAAGDYVKYRGTLTYPPTADGFMEYGTAVNSNQVPPLNNISLIDGDHLNEGYYTYIVWQFDPVAADPVPDPATAATLLPLERVSFMNEYIARVAGGVNPIIAQQVTGEEAELRLKALHNLLSHTYQPTAANPPRIQPYPITTLTGVNRDNRRGKTSKNCLQFTFYLSDSALAQIGP